MEISFLGWVTTIFVLCVTTFGLYICINAILILLAFISGVLTVLYFSYDGDKYRITTADLLDNPLEETSYTSSLVQVINRFNEPKRKVNTDRRITGSGSVDTFLHEIFGYIIRDYVLPWYSVITSDNEFIEEIRNTAQAVAVNISNRIKSVNWQTYLMGKPIEDIAGHLRLFRSAGGGVQSTSRYTRRGSPARSPPNNTPTHHRRNKSDTDVANYAGTQRYNISNSKFYVETKNRSNLSFDEKFFELEREMEKNIVSREKICSERELELAYLAELCQLLFYIGMDAEHFKGGATLSVMRAVCCLTVDSGMAYIADPDTLNVLFLRGACRDGLSSEAFLNVIRSTDNVDEIKYTLELVKKEIQNLVSHDTVGECDIMVKQQLSSLQYLVKMLNTRSSVLTPVSSSQLLETAPIVMELPLSFLLDNHLALCYFLDYAQGMGAHAYIFCHISIQAWRASVIKYFSSPKDESSTPRTKDTNITSIKTAAKGIYEQYLSNSSINKVDIPQPVLRNLLYNLDSVFIDEKCLTWFQDVEDCIYSKLMMVENGFKNSKQYSRLLAELDIENTNTDFPKYNDPSSGINMANRGSKSSLTSLTEGKPYDSDGEHSMGSSKFFIESASIASSQLKDLQQSQDISKQKKDLNTFHNQDPQKYIQQWIASQEPSHLEAVIVGTGLVQERGRPFGVYAIEVRRRCPVTGQQFCWHVYRRYSDFHELNINIKEYFPELSKMEFPSKKTFHNTSRSVLERRMQLLSTWLSTLAALGSPGGPPRYAPLHCRHLLPFLCPKGPHDKQNQPKSIDAILVEPLRQGMRTLKGVPGQFFNTVDDFMGGLYKVLNSGRSESNLVIPCQLQTVSLQYKEGPHINEDELPIRVLLLLLDEIFELKKRNQWLRRQIAAILRQLLTAMFSDVLNKRIIEFLSSITSPKMIVQCLDVIKRKYWPVGPVSKRSEFRDSAEKARARVAVKAVLLSICQEELKHIIGSETTQRGLMTVFELFQNPTLNKRLVFVLIEDLLCALYSDQDISAVFKRLLKTSKSPKMSHLKIF